ncbi:MAG TPA: hypothetical protein VGE98_11780 [Thermoanaerobaculia bacterium]
MHSIVSTPAPAKLAPRVVTDKLECFAYYGQVGYAITPQLKVDLQGEHASYDLNLGTGEALIARDVALGLAYSFDSLDRRRGDQLPRPS